jgi:polar amino acid transport system permease protein
MTDTEHPVATEPLMTASRTVQRRRHPGRWIGMAVILVLLAMLAHALVTNTRLQWNVVTQYLFSAEILNGVVLTLELTAGTMIIGTVLGTVVAVMRMSENRLLSGVAAVYIWILRSIPLLVQLLFWYNISALYPNLTLGIPFGPSLVSLNANKILPPIMAALIGLGLELSAFVSEIVRSGLSAVPKGQVDAATALGMRRGTIFGRIVMPQAIPIIIPPMTNMLVITIKATSLVSVLSLSDLLYTAETIYGRTYQTIPLLLVATIWYVFITLVITIAQIPLERRFGRAGTKTTQPGIATRFTMSLRSGIAFFVLPDRFRREMS